DKDDKPCVLVDGFRAISVAGVRRGIGNAARNVLYHVDWERTPATNSSEMLEPVPLPRLREAAQRALDEVIAARGRTRLEGAIAAQDDLAAALFCSALREMGAHVGQNVTANSLSVAPAMRPVFEQLMLKLKKRGLVKGDATGYRPTSAFAT